ncbi:hypothetical protein SEA_KIKO_51 [Gordonia phage Kiko]|nr:hypothetical protein SEA_KIKO_51 [Gordonia phage Kiko]
MDPDEWWNTLPPERRHQIYRWIEQPGESHPPTPGQRSLFPQLHPDSTADTDRGDGPRRRGDGHSRRRRARHT